jgi:plastocyanin
MLVRIAKIRAVKFHRLESIAMANPLDTGLESGWKPLTRRGLFAASALGAIALATPMSLTALAKDGEDDDDGDNSGSGGGGDGDNSGSGGGGDEDVPVITGQIPAGSVQITIVDDDANGFTPANLTVEVGQRVTFVNADKHEHTATGLEFDTGVFYPGETATIRLTKPGIFPYACQIHPVMVGTIEVLGDAPSESEPTASPDPNADPVTGEWQLTMTPDAAAAASEQLASIMFSQDGSLDFAVSESADPAQGVWTRETGGGYRTVILSPWGRGDSDTAGIVALTLLFRIDNDALTGTYTAITGDTPPVLITGTLAGERVVPAAGANATPTAPTAGSGGTADVAVIDFAFDPPSLEVTAGTTVTWTNVGAAPHTATAEDGSFTTKPLQPGDSESHTFSTPGRYAYLCAYHPNMTATIVVS